MSRTLSSEWLAEGFEHGQDRSYCMPHRVLKVDLEMESERRLTAAETAVLELVCGGVGDPRVIAELMGLPDERLVTRSVILLHRNGALSTGEAGLLATEAGRVMARQGRVRETTHVTETLRLEPVRERLAWRIDGELTAAERPERQLPLFADFDESALRRRLPDLQDLVARDGLPSDDECPPDERPTREVLEVRVLDAWLGARRATVETWRHPQSGEERPLLRVAGEEDARGTERLRAGARSPESGSRR